MAIRTLDSKDKYDDILSTRKNEMAYTENKNNTTAKNESDTIDIKNKDKDNKDTLYEKFLNYCKKNTKKEYSDIDKLLIENKLNRSNFTNFIEWCAGKNYFGFYKEDERDPNKIGWTADKTVNKLFMDEVCGIGSITIGALLMPLCPFLGIAIIATGVIPSPVKKALMKELQEDTLNIIPFEKIPSIRDKVSEKAGKVEGNIDNRIKTFAKILKEVGKEQELLRNGKRSNQKSM